jgi:hypothetical protein
MTNHDFFLKLRAYWLFWKQQQELAKQGLPAMTTFRVLTTCRSHERFENLRKLAGGVDDKQTGSEMFWFAEESSIEPHQAESIWQPIWQTPKDDKTHHLLE